MSFTTWPTVPPWPPVAGRTRATISGFVVDYTGGTPPTPAEVMTQAAPSQAELDAMAAANVIAIQTSLGVVVGAGTFILPGGGGTLHAANISTNTALTTGLSHFLYLGKTPTPITSLKFLANVTVIGAGITWAEVAVFKGPLVPNGNASLTRLGFTNVAGIVTANGPKVVTITLAGVTAGDYLWLAYGSLATTPFQLAGLLADRIMSGVFQTASVRPSLAASPQATTIAGAAVVPAWTAGVI